MSTTTGRTAMTPEQMDRVLDEHFACEAAHDLDGLLGTLTDDAEHDVPGMPAGPIQGHEAIRRFYEGVHSMLTQEDVRPLRRYHGDNFMVDEVLYTGDADGALFGLEGRRGRVSFRLLHVLEFRDGLISRENAWLDFEAARRQLLAGDGV
jgi:ketosteroid isomerase-like protein